MIVGWVIGFVVGCVCGYIVGRTVHAHIQTNVGNNSVQIQTINKEREKNETMVICVTEKDRNDVLDWLNQIANPDDVNWAEFYSDSEIRLLAKNAIDLIKEVKE